MDGGQGLPLTDTNIATNIVANIATNIATNIVAHQYCHKYCYYTLLSVLFYFMPQESQSQAARLPAVLVVVRFSDPLP